MQTQTKQPDTDSRDTDMDEEIADVLTAISVVAKRLARKLTLLSRQENSVGGKSDEQNE